MTNEDALGYMLVACRDIGLSRLQAQTLYREMHIAFDVLTEDEAYEQGYRWMRKGEK